MLYPLQALILHNHFPLGCLAGICTSYPVDISLGHLQHYRYSRPSPALGPLQHYRYSQHWHLQSWDTSSTTGIPARPSPALGPLQHYRYSRPWGTTSSTSISSLGTPLALQVFPYSHLWTPQALHVFPALGHLQHYRYSQHWHLQYWDTSGTTGIPSINTYSIGTPPALKVFSALGLLQHYRWSQPWDTSSTTGIPSIWTSPPLQVFPALTLQLWNISSTGTSSTYTTVLGHLQHYRYSPSIDTAALGHLQHYRYSQNRHYSLRTPRALQVFPESTLQPYGTSSTTGISSMETSL